MNVDQPGQLRQSPPKFTRLQSGLGRLKAADGPNGLTGEDEGVLMAQAGPGQVIRALEWTADDYLRHSRFVLRGGQEGKLATEAIITQA